MNINFKQSQFELFPGTQGAVTDVSKPRVFFAHLTFSLENLVVVGIGMLLVLILSFSFGVEKGKRIMIARYTSQKERSASGSEPINGHSVPPVGGAQAKPQLPLTPSPDLDRASRKPPSLSVPNQDAGSTISSAVAKLIEHKLAAPEAANESGQTSPAVVYSPAKDFPDKPYTVQVASFKTDEYAQKEAAALKEKGYDILVMPKGQHTIVCVGRFSDQKEAERFSDGFKRKNKEYQDCLVRRL